MPRPASNDNLDYERIGRFIYAYQRLHLPIEQLMSAQLKIAAPPELLRRAASLDQKYQQIVNNFAATPEVELESTLREAGELSAEASQFLGGR